MTTKKQAMEALEEMLQAGREAGETINPSTENHRRRAWEVFVGWAAGHAINPMACSDEELVGYIRDAHSGHGGIERRWSKHLFATMNRIYEHRGIEPNPARRDSPARRKGRELGQE